MTQFPHDDQPLKQFLRQHRPIPPGATVDLEEQLMQSIRAMPPHSSPRSLRFSRKTLLLPAIAIGVVLSWLAYRVVYPPAPSAMEMSQLEAFMEANWDNFLDEPPSESHDFDPLF